MSNQWEKEENIEDKILGELGAGHPLSTMYRARGGSSAIDKFVEPGEDIVRLLMRCDFLTQDQCTAAGLYLGACRHFHATELEEELLMFLAAQTSIKGKRADILLRAVVADLGLLGGKRDDFASS